MLMIAFINIQFKSIKKYDELMYDKLNMKF